MGAFMVTILKVPAEEAFRKFHPYSHLLVPFRDASKGACNYECTVLHCLQGLEFAIQKGWYSFKDFDVRQYEYYERVENGDLNWIIPGQFMAFMGPVDHRQPGSKAGFTPEDYAAIFKELNVSLVVRLNEEKYDRRRFQQAGIQHHDMFFIDGSNPSDEIVEGFLRASERHFNQKGGAIAVHCKAGLGRTGTLIGCYAMKHYGISAEAFIGWIRICRPGSILGPQQYFLVNKQYELGLGVRPYNTRQHTALEMSPQDKVKSI